METLPDDLRSVEEEFSWKKKRKKNFPALGIELRTYRQRPEPLTTVPQSRS